MILEEDRDFLGFVFQRHMKNSTVQAQSREILCFMEDSFQQDFPDINHILTQQDTKHLYWLCIILGHRFDGICNISLAQLCLHTPLHTYRIARHNHTNTTRKAGERWLKYVHPIFITITSECFSVHLINRFSLPRGKEKNPPK